MLNLKPKYWKQIILLLLITPVLTELLTNNIPAPKFFKLNTFFALVVLGYAPVLLLRELAVRWKLSFTGYVLLGLVYGLYNEGLLAKTIFQTHLPSPTFNNYGILFGINFSWTAIILIFHAFYAFLFPVLMMYYFFPAAARKPWIDKRLWLFISAAFFLYISLKFLRKMLPPVTLSHYIFLAGTMTLLVIFSNFFKDDKMFEIKRIKVWPPGIYGFVFVFAIFTVSDVIIKAGIYPLIFISYLLAILIMSIALLRKSNIRALMVFCLMAEITFAASVLLVAKISNSTTGMITEGFFVAVFLIFLVTVVRRKQPYRVNHHFG